MKLFLLLTDWFRKVKTMENSEIERRLLNLSYDFKQSNESETQ